MSQITQTNQFIKIKGTFFLMWLQEKSLLCLPKYFRYTRRRIQITSPLRQPSWVVLKPSSSNPLERGLNQVLVNRTRRGDINSRLDCTGI
jgi:hypothetical protein